MKFYFDVEVDVEVPKWASARDILAIRKEVEGDLYQFIRDRLTQQPEVQEAEAFVSVSPI